MYSSKKAVVLSITILALTISPFSYAGFFQNMFSNISQILNIESTYTQTKHPIVLVHGGMGFDYTRLAGILPTDYWSNIPEELSRGGAEVYIIQASPIHTPQYRGEQIINQLETISAVSGHTKFNLIAHSYGAPTARYVAGVRPDMIASVSTVGGTNDSHFIEEILPIFENAAVSLNCDLNCVIDKLAGVINLGGHVAALLFGTSLTTEECTSDTSSSNPALAESALLSCLAANEEFANNGNDVDTVAIAKWAVNEFREFKTDYPEGMPTSHCSSGDEVGSNGVSYFSWTGNRLFTNPLDPIDYGMLVSGGALTLLTGYKSDGLVTVCDSKLGNVIRTDYPMNHFDEVNLLWGLTQPFFNVAGIYRQHANRLKVKGL